MRLLRILAYEGDEKSVTQMLERGAIKHSGTVFFHDGAYPRGVKVTEIERIDVTPAGAHERLSPTELLRQSLYDSIDGGSDGNRGQDHNITIWLDLLSKVERELQSLQSFKSSVDDALNTGDGSYRP
jgi:hypothetical protein